MTTHTSNQRSYLIILDPHQLLPSELRSHLQTNRRWNVANEKTKHHPSAALLVVAAQDTPSLQIHRFFTSVASIPMVIFDTAPALNRQMNAFHAGANGYIMPGITIPELLPLLDIAVQGGFATCVRSHQLAQSMLRGPLEFSKREQEVVTLYSLGASESAVAEELNISIKAVQDTLSRACRKVGVNSPVSLVMWWTRWSLAEPIPFADEEEEDDEVTATATPYVLSA